MVQLKSYELYINLGFRYDLSSLQKGIVNAFKENNWPILYYKN